MLDIKKAAKKVGAVGVTVAVLTTTLVACSGGSSNTASTTLSFPSHFWAEAGSAFPHAVVDKFKAANPSFTVEMPPVPFSDYHNKVYTQMASGQAPDVIVPFDPQIGQWAREGLLEPLDDCLAGHNLDTSKLIAGQKVAQIEGKTYGLLLYSNPRVLAYNQQMFADAGVAVPKNLDEFKAAMAALRNPSKQEFGFATISGAESPVETYISLMPIIAGFGGTFVTDGKATADSKEVVAALTLLKDLYDSDQMPKGMKQAGYYDAVMAGKVASTAIGSFIIGQAKEKNPAVAKNLTLETLPFPGKSTIAVNVFLSIPKAAKNKQAACDLIATTLDPDLQKNVATTEFSIPATGEVDPAFLQANPYFQATIDASKVAVSYAPRGAEAKMGDVQKIVSDVYQEMLTTPMSGQEAGAKIQSELEKLLH